MMMVKLDNVVYQYKQEKFLFDFTVERGQITAILGGSGAGKSTLLSLLAGFVRPMSGNISISGESVLNKEPYQRPLAMLFQESNLFAHLRVADNIGIGLHPGLKLSNEQHAQVEEIASKVGIETLLDRYPEQLSGGQKQRVALARCFVQNKPLLLLDEPFSALDPLLREEMLTIVKHLARERNTTVLMVTHHISDAYNAASHYLFVEQGAILSTDKIDMLNSINLPNSVRNFVQASS